ncbi:hypothetical protein [Sphingobium aromaticiconvertens]|uniref:hypothetical protein n=1 Tax=Sphingobium aromaticiconvertens TaxID=365341 RepID=UPI0030168EF5
MRNATSLIFTLIPMALLGACVAPSERTPPPAPRPAPATPTPTPTPTPPASPAPASTEWQYRPATAGDWTYRTEGAGSAALFRTASDPAMLSIRCDQASHRISVARTGAGSGPMTIRTSYGAVNWPASTTAGATAQTIATRAANDSVLDQIAYSRGRFGVDVQGLPPLILPAWAEVARVVEDCRG